MGRRVKGQFVITGHSYLVWLLSSVLPSSDWECNVMKLLFWPIATSQHGGGVCYASHHSLLFWLPNAVCWCVCVLRRIRKERWQIFRQLPLCLKDVGLLVLLALRAKDVAPLQHRSANYLTYGWRCSLVVSALDSDREVVGWRPALAAGDRVATVGQLLFAPLGLLNPPSSWGR